MPLAAMVADDQDTGDEEAKGNDDADVDEHRDVDGDCSDGVRESDGDHHTAPVLGL